jgi:hypothetical protein
MTAKAQKEWLEQRIGKQIQLIDRLDDTHHVTVIAVRDSLFVVKFTWGGLLDIAYNNDEYDFKD